MFQLATDDELAFALILRDVTERKRQDRDLRHAKETAELANRAKSSSWPTCRTSCARR